MAEEKNAIDRLDGQIIEALAVDGRVSFKEIARNLGVSDGTIRFRFGRLVESGLIRVAALRNPLVQKHGLSALVGMVLEKRTHHSSMKKISSLPGVLSVVNVTGRFDLVVEIYLPSQDALNKFLFYDLAEVETVRSTETFILLDAINKWVQIRPESDSDFS